ncbi:MAG: hypothetical protein HY900_13565 [Deltaproteobacteria bacterium]|nr:hypothetical protein [Deltaproteobacteria bacterium]
MLPDPVPPPPASGFGPPPPPAPGGTVTVRPLPDGEEIVLRPTGWVRFLPAAFLAFWICGWAAGELVVLTILLGPFAEPLFEGLREALPGTWPRLPRFAGDTPWPVVVFLSIWFAFWTWGGLSALRELLRLLAGRDLFSTRPGGFTVRRCAGPFGRSKSYAAPQVSAVFAQPRRSRLVAVVGGKETVLSTGTPLPVAEWLAERLRAALGLRSPAASDGAAAEAAAIAEAPVPREWCAEALPEGGVLLSALPARSRKTAGCALTLALVLSTAFVAFVRADFERAAWGVVLFGIVAFAIDLLCLWAAFARETWRLAPSRIARTWRLGPWERRREVRHGALTVSVTSDSDGDDWFLLEARGDGAPLRMAKAANDGPAVLELARYAARQSGFPLDVPREVRAAAGEPGGG